MTLEDIFVALRPGERATIDVDVRGAWLCVERYGDGECHAVKAHIPNIELALARCDITKARLFELLETLRGGPLRPDLTP